MLTLLLLLLSLQCPYGHVNVEDPGKKKHFNSLFYVWRRSEVTAGVSMPSVVCAFTHSGLFEGLVSLTTFVLNDEIPGIQVQPPALEPAWITVIHCDLTLRAVGQLLSCKGTWTPAFCFNLEYFIMAGDLFFWCLSTLVLPWYFKHVEWKHPAVLWGSLHCCALIEICRWCKKEIVHFKWLHKANQTGDNDLAGMCWHWSWCKRKGDTKDHNVDLY